MTLPLSGTATVTNGQDDFTVDGFTLTALTAPEGMPITLGGLTYFVKERVSTTAGKLTRPYAGANGTIPAEISQFTAEQTETAKLSRRTVDVIQQLTVTDANGRGLFYNLIGVTGAGDPGPGNVAFNAPIPANISEIYLDVIDANQGGRLVSGIIDLWNYNTTLVFRSLSTAAYLAVRLLDVPENEGGWRAIAVQYVGHDGLLGDEPIAIEWRLAGVDIDADVLVSPLLFMSASERQDVLSGAATMNVAYAVNAAFNATPTGHVVIPNVKMLINDPIELIDGLILDVRNPLFVTQDSDIDIMRGTSKKDFRINGSMRFKGTYGPGHARAASGFRAPSAQRGLVLDSCWDYEIGSVAARDMRGSAVAILPTAGTTSPVLYGDRGTIEVVRTANCETGIDTTPAGAGAEYMTWGRVDVSGGHTGLKLAAGNHAFGLGISGKNDVGVELVAGPNHLHGIINNLQLNHNLKPVVAKGIFWGQDFAGCHIYEGTMEFEACSNIVFHGGLLEIPSIVATVGSGSPAAGPIRFRDMNLQNGYGQLAVTGDAAKLVIFRNCFGPGANVLSSDGEYEIIAYRSGATQNIGSGAVPLTFGALARGRSDIFDVATGIYTAQEDGTHEVSWQLVVSGTTLDATISYLDVLYSHNNGAFVSDVLDLPKTKFAGSTPLLVFSGKYRTGINKGDRFRLDVNIAGTGAKHGATDWLSLLSVRKTT